MLRVLFLKEWKQLRALRWVGLGLGLVVLLVALAAPAAARAGWLPFAEITRSYSAKEIVLDALPAAFAIGLWPLIALLVVVQTFAGDRNTGTESFLLERPVSRARVWSARLLASALTVAVAVVGHLALWWVVMKLSVDPASQELTRPSFILGVVGPAAVVCCLLAGMLAASLLSSPMAALLLGIVLLAIPLQLAGTLVGAFPLAAYRGIPVGPIASILLLLAYPLASFLALCRGEPAGRGRIKRGVVTVAVALVAACALFVVSATAAIRLSARQLRNGSQVTGSLEGGATYAPGAVGGWIIDLDTYESIRFIPGSSWLAGWNQDGTILASATFSGALGWAKPSWNVEFFGAGGERFGRDLTLANDENFNRFTWVGDRLLLTTRDPSGNRIVVYDPRTGEHQDIGFELSSWHRALVGPIDDGRVFLSREIETDAEGDAATDDGPDRRKGVHYGLFRVDLERGALDAEPLVTDHGWPVFGIWLLSPSGRYWLVPEKRGLGTPGAILDIESGERIPIEGLDRSAHWLSKDRAVWIAREAETTHLRMMTPGQEPRTLRSWNGTRAEIKAHGSRLLVDVHSVLEEQAAGDASIPTRRQSEATWVYEADTDRWIELARWPTTAFSGHDYQSMWAGPRTVARTGPGVLAFESIDAPGELNAFLGEP